MVTAAAPIVRIGRTKSWLGRTLALALILAPGCSSSSGPPLLTQSPAPTAALADVPVPETFNVADLAERVRPAVVSITTTQHVASTSPFQFFFGPDGPSMPRERMGAGTGFVIDASGLVVTNEHVVHDADEVRIALSDNREYDARVIGRDEKLDLALLQVDAGTGQLPHVELGSSDGLRVGEHVVAVGNPYGLGQTVTLGIVSAKARTIGAGPYDDFIQTDASINPGNSGGPLFNWRGEVVGINTAIRPGANGIGFAIPIDALKDVLGQLRERGHVVRGKLGLLFQPVTVDLAQALELDRPRGALVAQIQPGSSAERAGLREGDLIVGINGTSIEQAEELPRNVARHTPGTKIRIDVLRDGDIVTVQAELDLLEEEHSKVERPETDEPKAKPAGKLGIAVSNAQGGGVRVDQVDPQSEIRDLLRGDVIIGVNGERVSNFEELREAVEDLEPGSMAILRIRRGDMLRFAAVPVPK